MVLLLNILIFLLIFSVVAGLLGMFLYKNYLKKISCLSVAYVSLILILVIFLKNSVESGQLSAVIFTMLILFSITLAIGIGIISNIDRLKNDQ